MVKDKSKENKKVTCMDQSGPIGFVFFVAFIGAAVYFVQQTEGFWNVVLALLKATVWPAFVVYESLKLLGA